MDTTIHRAVLRTALALAFISAGCARPGVQPSIGGDNMLTVAQQRAGWRLLFDGHDMSAWRGYRSGGIPAGWSVVDGTIRKDTETEDIVTKDEFTDFELEIDWKIGTAGNSGIFYRGTEQYDHIYWSAPEYQLLDDANAPDGKSRLTAAGSDYALYPAPAGILKPANEWNTSRIVVQGKNVEHWLNGQMLLAYEFGSPDWEARVKASKFAAWPNYGKAKSGHIGIQGDHPGMLVLKNIRIRVIK